MCALFAHLYKQNKGCFTFLLSPPLFHLLYQLGSEVCWGRGSGAGALWMSGFQGPGSAPCGSPLPGPASPGRLPHLPGCRARSGNSRQRTAPLCLISHSSPNLHFGGVKRLSFLFKRILFPGYSVLKQTPSACQRSIKKNCRPECPEGCLS